MNCCHTLATILLLVDAYYNTKLTSNEMTYSSDTNLPIFILLFFSGNTVQRHIFFFFFFNDTPPTEIYPLPLHDVLPISVKDGCRGAFVCPFTITRVPHGDPGHDAVFAAAQDLDVPLAVHPTFEPIAFNVHHRFDKFEIGRAHV